MQRILITGASGFIGRRTADLLSDMGAVTGTYFAKPAQGLLPLDVRDSHQTSQLFEQLRPDIVVHTVALSDPDICEQRPVGAKAINYIGTRNVVEACRRIGAKLFYISTVYVFDGTKGNYLETDQPSQPIWSHQT